MIEWVWRSADTDEPGDQIYEDVPPGSDPKISYWGAIGPEDEGRWSWTIQALKDGDQWTADNGYATSEAEVKAIIEAWRENA